jgi:hypothetical protein
MTLPRAAMPSFAGGEISPQVEGRFDTEKYQAALRRARNVLIEPEGGVYNRPGLEWCGAVRDEASPVILIPFQSAPNLAYVLEFGDETLRFLFDGGYVLEEAKTIDDANSVGGSPPYLFVLDITGHGYAVGDDIYLEMTGPAQANGRVLRVTAVTTDTVTFEVDARAWDSFDTPATASRILTLDTPYAADELEGLGFEQSNDIMLLTHLSYPPYTLTRVAADDWTLEETVYGTTTPTPTVPTVTAYRPNTPGGWDPKPHKYAITAVDEVTGRESLVSPTGTTNVDNDITINGNWNNLSWSSVTGAEYYIIYKVVNGNYGYIGTSETLTFTDDNINPDLSDTPPRDTQIFDAADKYPAVVTFHEQRAVFARTTEKPGGIFGSRSSDFNNMNVRRPLQADDAYSFNVVGRKANAIRHLLPMKRLLALTDTAVFSIFGDGGFISPIDVRIDNEGYRGASSVRPVLLDENVAIYASALGSAVRTLGFQFDRDGYKGNDISIYARHLFKGFTILDMAWAEYPTATLWVVRSDGKLATLTWQAEQQVWGWSLCETDGTVEAVCCVTENGEDVAYFVVSRTVDGEDRKFVERITTTLWSDIDDACYLDSARRYSGSPATIIRGLDHLEGATVTALADGSVRTGLVVSGGKITLPVAASSVVVGLPYEAWLWTLPIVQQAQGYGSTKARKQALASVVVTVQNTRGIEVGVGRRQLVGQAETSNQAAGSTFYEIITRNEELVGEADYLRSGDLSADLPPGDWTEATLVIRQRYPLPMKILGVFPDVAMGE